MFKKLFVVFFFITLLFANPYEKNCVTCHAKIVVGLDKIFMRYLLAYSSEKNIKEALFYFLAAPTKEQSQMGEAFIRRFGLKKPSKLSAQALREAIDIYYKTYDVKKRLQ